MGEINEAIESYHQALSRKPDDPFASDMLHRALYEALDVPEPNILVDNTHDESFAASEYNVGDITPPRFASPTAFTPRSATMNMSATMMQSGGTRYQRDSNPNMGTAEDHSEYTLDSGDVDMTMT